MKTTSISNIVPAHNEEKNLNGKVCMVVGGTKGMGFAAAKKLYDLGAKVAICGRSISTTKIAAKNIDPLLRNLLYFKCDINKPVDIKLMVDVIIDKWGKVDNLVCAAGIFKPFGTFESVPFGEHERTLKTNLLGTMRICHEVIKYMKKRKSGNIILFSGAGIGNALPLDNASSYYVSKGGLALFAEVLAEELSPFNIKINAILPGRILTDSTRSIIGLPEKTIGKVLYEATAELKKGGQPVEQVTNLISFLAGNISNSLTGKLISAKWDSFTDLSSDLPNWKYTLRRIEGKKYIKNK